MMIELISIAFRLIRSAEEMELPKDASAIRNHIVISISNKDVIAVGYYRVANGPSLIEGSLGLPHDKPGRFSNNFSSSIQISF